MRVWRCLGAIVLIVLFHNAAFGQTRKPLSVEEIEELTKAGVTAQPMITLIGKRGVGFAVTDSVRERLTKVGVDASVLEALEQTGSEAASKKAGKASHRGETGSASAKNFVARDGKEMVEVPGGEFYMGCNEKVDTECDDDEKPGKIFSVDAFRIDRTEVTVAEYGRCVDAGECTSDGLVFPEGTKVTTKNGVDHSDWLKACNWGKAGHGNWPINCVDWQQAQAYCRWAGKRLPTEAEWEKAARGTDGRKYPWGNRGFEAAGGVANIADATFKRNNPDQEAAEGYDDGFLGTAPVGSFPAGVSPYGALDMIGNVWEWTADWYDQEHKYRVGRGGSWGSPNRGAIARLIAMGMSQATAPRISGFAVPSS